MQKGGPPVRMASNALEYNDYSIASGGLAYIRIANAVIQFV